VEHFGDDPAPAVNAEHADRIVIASVDPKRLVLRRVPPTQPLFQAFGRKQLLRREAHLDCKAQRTVARHRGVARLLHDEPRNRNRVLDLVEVADRPGAMRRAVHDACVELDLALGVRQTAVSNAGHVGIVLDEVDAFFDCIEQRSTARKDLAGTPIGVDAEIPRGQKDRTVVARLRRSRRRRAQRHCGRTGSEKKAASIDWFHELTPVVKPKERLLDIARLLRSGATAEKGARQARA
jgi:hypothetical protein